jgi:hypothetical protein
MYGSNFGSREHVYEPFDRVIDEISATVDGLNLDSIKDSNETENQIDSIQDGDPEQMLSRLVICLYYSIFGFKRIKVKLSTYMLLLFIYLTIFRIDLARKRLSITLEKMPPQSPKKRAPVEVERNKILLDIGKLSQA